MKNCTNCNAECVDSANFCAECGAAFSQTETDSSNAQSSQTDGDYLVHTIVHGDNTAQTNSTAQTNAQANATAAINRNIENHLVKSIISTICCCIPFSAIAIYFSLQVDKCLKANDLNGALEASQKASLWGNLSIGAGIVGIVTWILCFGAAMSAMMNELMPFLE